MSYTFQDIKYGWKAIAGIVLTGITIYVASNTRWRVYQIDEIEIVLGTYERCLATQYSSNPVSYRISPPSFIRDWTDTNGVSYRFTNVIGWRTDYLMISDLDATIKSLLPYYVNTTLTGWETNPQPWTVTGAFAYLSIGDGTNQFTQVPASGTNAAIFGALGKRLYVSTLQERYKVLYLMSAITSRVEEFNIVGNYGVYNDLTTNLSDTTRTEAYNIYITNNVPNGSDHQYLKQGWENFVIWNNLAVATIDKTRPKLKCLNPDTTTFNFTTNIPHNINMYVTPRANVRPGYSTNGYIYAYADFGTGWIEDQANLVYSSGYVTNSVIISDYIDGEVDYTITWPAEPIFPTAPGLPSFSYLGHIRYRSGIAEFQFSYCINQYW